MSKIVVEKGVKLAPVAREYPTKYPFDKMKVNESFFAEGMQMQSMHSNIYRFTRTKGQGKKFSVRTVTEKGVKGVRVWRVA